jgi:predicted tellurium resistance membrane protein TerC
VLSLHTLRGKVLGLTVEQLLILAGVGVALIVLLMILRAIFRLTRAFLRLGCLGVIIVLVIAFALMRGLAG